jgi:4-amino-4-deoxy-L-arabinose transferase-like glycosyltransferase
MTKEYNEKALLTLLVALCLVLFFFRLGERPLWDIDEGMHAATSKTMVLTGDWITPKHNGNNFYDKPALYNWFVAGAYEVLGFTELASRLPSAILGLACVLATYLMGKRMFNPLAGFLGASVLATSLLFLIHARFVVHDIALAFFITTALYAFFQAYRDEEHRTWNLVLFYLSLGLAMLAKGPLGVVLPGLTIGPFLLFRKDLKFLLKMKLHWGIPLFLAVAAPWYILISMAQPDYAYFFFIEKNFGSFTTGGTHHSRPLHYYVPVLLGGFFPWSIFLPLTLVRAFKTRRALRSGAVDYLLLWAGSVFVFFSLASSKLGTYLLPMFPALALLTGHAWYELFKEPALRKGFIYSFLPVVILFPSALVYMLIDPVTDLKTEAGIDLGRFNMMVLGVALIAAIGFIFLLMRRYRAFFASITGMVIFALIFMLLYLAPPVNEFRSSKGLVQKLDPIMRPGEDLVFYHRMMDSSLFYTNRKVVVLKSREALKEYFSTTNRVFCLLHEKYLRRIDNYEEFAYIVDQLGCNVVLSNRTTT